jgi:hypothetical protein
MTARRPAAEEPLDDLLLFLDLVGAAPELRLGFAAAADLRV